MHPGCSIVTWFSLESGLECTFGVIVLILVTDKELVVLAHSNTIWEAELTWFSSNPPNGLDGFCIFRKLVDHAIGSSANVDAGLIICGYASWGGEVLDF